MQQKATIPFVFHNGLWICVCVCVLVVCVTGRREVLSLCLCLLVMNNIDKSMALCCSEAGLQLLKVNMHEYMKSMFKMPLAI